MNHLTRSLIATTFAAFGAAPAAAAPATLEAGAAARLETLRRTPEAAGELIYRGRVVPQDAPGSAALFTYERRVGRSDAGLSSAHITTDAQGRVIIAEQAQITPAYALRRFDAANLQQGYSGSVEVSADGRRLDFRLHRDGKTTTATEEVHDPVVSGPSLHGFILQHWDRLAAGGTVPVRMIVMTRKQTYGFDIRRQSQADGRSSFSITPSSLLVRLVVAPLTVSFDDRSRNVVRYEGRVPPMRAEHGRLVDLDARVDYTMAVPVYR